MSFFVALQKVLPQHGLSRFVGALARSELGLVKTPFIRTFASAYNVNMGEAAREDLSDYRSFNDFFTRELKDDARPIAEGEDTIVCPADGAVSQLGTIEQGQVLQAKGIRYRFDTLAAEAAGPGFGGGSFITIYLAPSDYHRVHMPLEGRLVRSVAVPGELFSVNAHTEAEVPSLFARNERLVCEFDTAHGRVLSIMVGAMIVASIETVWGGPESPYRQHTVTEHDQPLGRGAEMGRFLLGSTVILCFEKGRAELSDDLEPGTTVRMGQPLGRLT